MRWLCFVLAVLAAASAAPVRAETLPLPEGVIAFDSADGEALLIGADAQHDYYQLSIHFVTQANPAFCGPASIAMILNAAGLPRPPSDRTLGLGMFDQENIFTPATEAVKPRQSIMRSGMTLDELGAMFAAHGLNARVRHAAEASLDEFRSAAVAALGDDDHFVVVNYLRKAIGQKTGGHISPLAAYNSKADRFLIMDVSRYKYPPAWVAAKALFGAMNTTDADNNGKSRGYVIVGP